jgi:hypothetical protein
LINKLEYHTSFPFVYGGFVSQKKIKNYEMYVNALYDSINKHSPEKHCYIDSSKYPTRALLLNSTLKSMKIYVIYVVRNPIGVVNSLQDKDKNQRYTNFFSANLYYFVINFFSYLVQQRLGPKCLKIKYEDLIGKPVITIKKISQFTGVEFEPAIIRINQNLPLERGSVFNGNRLRMKKKVILKIGKKTYKNSIKNIITKLINFPWY